MFQATVFTLESILTAQQPISFSGCDLWRSLPFFCQGRRHGALMLWDFQGFRVCQPLSGEEGVLSKPGALVEILLPLEASTFPYGAGGSRPSAEPW